MQQNKDGNIMPSGPSSSPANGQQMDLEVMMNDEEGPTDDSNNSEKAVSSLTEPKTNSSQSVHEGSSEESS